jgi:hypothetical protein
MVLASLGRPPRRLRENADGQEYEEWIYGSPPQEVYFIRFVHGKVVRIEQMKITGEKLVRTADEVGKVDGLLDASAQKTGIGDPASAATATAPAMAAPGEATATAKPASAAPETPRKKPPTLLHAGEAAPPSN